MSRAKSKEDLPVIKPTGSLTFHSNTVNAEYVEETLKSLTFCVLLA